MARGRTTNTRKTNNRNRDREAILLERRKVRDDLGTFRDLMSYPDVPGLWFRYVNDIRDRIAWFKKLGWSIYEEENFEPGQSGVLENNISPGTGAVIPAGRGINSVLMCIPKEFWDADQEIKAQKTVDIEDSRKQLNAEQGLVKRPV